LPEREPDEVELGGPVNRIRVSLRFGGDDLDPSVMTRGLGVDPTFAARKGESVERSGHTYRQRTGVWYLALPDRSEWELGDAIQTLLARIPASASTVRQLSAQYGGEIFCGLFLEQYNRGCAIDANIVSALAERGLALDFDIYGFEDPAA
jgi:hypothetical protein